MVGLPGKPRQERMQVERRVEWEPHRWKFKRLVVAFAAFVTLDE